MIPFNPCGLAVDWCTAAYTRRCRFHASKDAPWVTIRWYPTNLPWLPSESLINNRVWDSDTVDELVVGEDTLDRPHAYNSGPIGGLLGDHFCGTESDFQNGADWPYTGEPIEYDADGIPTCCPRDNVAFVKTAFRPAGEVSKEMFATANVATVFQPAATVDKVSEITTNEVTAMRPQADVFHYHQSYDCDFSTGFTLPTFTFEKTYRAVFETRAWTLSSPAVSGVGGQWVLQSARPATPTQLWHSTDWDGTGSAAFAPDAGNIAPWDVPVVITGN